MSRKFLTPIVLPADPTAAMEAATKQYVDAHAGGGGAEEVFVGTTDPGVGAGYDMWYDTDAPSLTPPASTGLPVGGTTGQLLSKKSGTDYDAEWKAPSGLASDPAFKTQYAIVRIGTFTPTLVGAAIGTGGSALNTAGWNFIGLEAGEGVITVDGQIIFGTTGVTLPGAAITISLPPGYSLIDSGSVASFITGTVFYGMASGNNTGPFRFNSVTSLRPTIFTVSGAKLIDTGTNAYAWANGDGFKYHYSARVLAAA